MSRLIPLPCANWIVADVVAPMLHSCVLMTHVVAQAGFMEWVGLTVMVRYGKPCNGIVMVVPVISMRSSGGFWLECHLAITNGLRMCHGDSHGSMEQEICVLEVSQWGCPETIRWLMMEILQW